MSGLVWLDWTALTVSIFNTILLFWLGLTVLMNSDRRSFGIWLAGSELVLGGIFFLSHSILLGHGSELFSRQLDFWWRLGSLPVASLPFAWYGIILWYSGFWEPAGAILHRRHRGWLVAASSTALIVFSLLIFDNPLPSFQHGSLPPSNEFIRIAGMPLLVIVFTVYILLCTTLSMDALRHPAPSGRVMGDTARHRARSWLVAVSILLLLVSLLVAWVIIWYSENANNFGFDSALMPTVARFDLIIAAFITAAVLLVGQAIVAYEIFTGRSLPRHGLRQYWQRGIFLAAGFSIAAGWGLVTGLRSIYIVAFSAILITMFYATLTWRAYTERQDLLAKLRPFVASQHLYDQMARISEETGKMQLTQRAFTALCRDLLGTRGALLLPVGPASSLVLTTLAYPDRLLKPPGSLSELSQHLSKQAELFIPIDPQLYDNYSWAIPLWSERGLIGCLLLQDKLDNGLYTQEEIEIARSTGERLLDAQVSAELARRLMNLQRRHMVEGQVMDQRTRRILHDDVLPQLHAAMLEINTSQHGASENALSVLGMLHRQIAGLLHDLPRANSTEHTHLGLTGALRNVMDDELSGEFDQISWMFDESFEGRAGRLPPVVSEVVYFAAREALRNAAHHARIPDPAAQLHLKIEGKWQDGLFLMIEDNGIGLAGQASTEGGSGQGLILHSTLMAVIGGSLELDSVPGKYTRVILRVPQGETLLGA